MKILLNVLLSGILSSALFASPLAPTQRCPGDFTVEAEWIYFSPSSLTRFIATPLVEEEVATIFADRYDNYYSGYRVGTAYTFCGECDRFISVLWSSLRARESRDLDSSSIGFQTQFGFTGPTINSSSNFRYYAIDGVFGQNVLSNCCTNIDFLAGVHYAHFMSKTHLFSPTDFFGTPNPFTADERNDYWGLGPLLGIHTYTPLKWGFAFIADASIAGLFGKPTYTVFAFGSNILIANAELERVWRWVPYTNFRLALDYDFCVPWNFGCFANCFQRGIRGSLQVGYEGLTYFQVLTSSETVGNTPNRNVNLHGPFVAASLNF